MTLRRLTFLAVCALAALGTVAPAAAQSLAVKQALGLSASSPPPSYGIDFRLGSATGWSNTRASTAMAANNAGTWTDFPTTTVRVTNRGALVEASKINIVKFNNDLTNVLWIKSNATAALDQTGIDAAVNGASSLLATAANATVLQTIVSASASRQPSAFVRRLIGTGPVDMTIDGGTTWVSIAPCASTVAIGMPECRVSIPPQTVTNPVIGFRLQTSGDKVVIAAAQSETNSIVPSSPIFTGAANVTRAGDIITLDVPPTFTNSITIAVSMTQDFASLAFGLDGTGVTVSDGTANNRLLVQLFNIIQGGPVAGYSTAAAVAGSAPGNRRGAARGGIRTTLVASFTNGSVRFSVNGGPMAMLASSLILPTGLNAVHIGSLANGGSPLYGYVEAVYLWKDVALNEPQMRSWWNGR